MNTVLLWLVISAAAWVGAGVIAGLFLGRFIRHGNPTHDDEAMALANSGHQTPAGGEPADSPRSASSSSQPGPPFDVDEWEKRYAQS